MFWPMQEIERFFKANGEGRPCGVAVIDIDFFIRFCLRLDDAAITVIMENISRFIQRSLPYQARVWKSGGDEFLMVCPGMSRHSLAQYMVSLKKVFKKEKFAGPVSKKYANVPLSFSAGVAAFPDDGQAIGEVIKRATTGLFLAKAYRRNRIHEAPVDTADGMENMLWRPDFNIDVIIGRYGEVGTLNGTSAYRDVLLWEPQAIATDDAGHLYIVDQNNHYILRCSGSRVEKIAGNGSYGYSGDGGAGHQARLNKPTGMSIWKNRLYITDTGNDVVRMLDMDSDLISTAAGTGEAGYDGDGGPAVLAKLNKPGGAAVDKDGNLYINDIVNNVIRKVDGRGAITTYAGNGSYGYTGDHGPAGEASFAEIYGICAGNRPGDLFIADYFNHCVRKIDGDTGIINTVAGTGQCGYSGDGDEPSMAHLDRPVAIHVDEHENIFIAESGNNCVRIVLSKRNKIFTLAGDGVCGIGSPGPVGKFRLANPNGLALDNNSRLYILDGANNRVCAVSLKSMEVN